MRYIHVTLGGGRSSFCLTEWGMITAGCIISKTREIPFWYNNWVPRKVTRDTTLACFEMVFEEERDVEYL